ncbi:hypothetical protein NDU88_007637 [Pleurodeles waltl]|uniref:Uncharacterized protein n=1 Tax=Pleurodeles waltl TaxID=8319 RepID=A0AAV7RUN6_PLEWA|nr:hypothetical protein NDU88_007637 [Pleurodeles waltl]
MDRMSGRLDKHAERLDNVEHRVSETEAEQAAVSTAHEKMDNLLLTLQAKIEDLEACSWRNNLRIVGTVETTNNDNAEFYIERLLINLLRHDSFLEIFVGEGAHHSLAPRLVPGTSHHPVMAKLLNYRDPNAALRKACDLKILQHEGSEIFL